MELNPADTGHVDHVELTLLAKKRLVPTLVALGK